MGRKVVLTEGAWSHIQVEHEDLPPSLPEIQEAIASAEEIRRDRDFGHRAVHYRQVNPAGLRLRVVVDYRPDERLGWIGEVVTAYVSGRRYRSEVQLRP